MNIFKNLRRKLAVKWIFRGYPKYVIASTGRAGSTMLCDAIIDSMIKNRFPGLTGGKFVKSLRRWCYGYLVRIGNISGETGHVFKTHDLLRLSPSKEIKYLFIYTDPLESAQSVQQVVRREGLVWFEAHQHHLCGHGDFDNLFQEDILNYEGQLASWLRNDRTDVLCIDYDDLWDEQQKLSQFVGFNIVLPAKRMREKKPDNIEINDKMFTRLRELKNSLKEKYLRSHVG